MLRSADEACRSEPVSFCNSLVPAAFSGSFFTAGAGLPAPLNMDYDPPQDPRARFSAIAFVCRRFRLGYRAVLCARSYQKRVESRRRRLSSSQPLLVTGW